MSKVRLSRRLKKEIPKQLWRRTKVQFILKRANRFHLRQFASAMRQVGLAARDAAKTFEEFGEVSK